MKMLSPTLTYKSINGSISPLLEKSIRRSTEASLRNSVYGLTLHSVSDLVSFTVSSSIWTLVYNSFNKGE